MHLFELRPNSSLTNRAAAVFFLSVGGMCLGIAAGFTALGLWPILPFAGLEIAILGGALAASLGRGRAREYIRVNGREVLIRKTRGSLWPHRQSRPVTAEIAFVREWTRVELRRADNGHWPSRLLLRSRGRAIEVGAFLTEGEREGLRRRLAEVIPGSDPDIGDGK